MSAWNIQVPEVNGVLLNVSGLLGDEEGTSGLSGDYADLALTSTRDTVHAEDLDDGLLSVRAARTVREELVRKAIDAGASLSEDLHHRDRPDGPDSDGGPA